MDDINKHKASNFWFGFALGVTASASALYLLGTPKGRKTLKKLIEFAENTDIEEYLENIMNQFDEGSSTNEKQIESAHDGHKPHQQNALGGLIDKIQSLTESSKDKKFFVKE